MNPTGRCVLLLTIGIAFAAVPALVGPHLWPLWLTFFALSIGAFALDAVRLVRPASLRLTHEIPAQIYIGDTAKLVLRLQLKEPRRALQVTVLCDLDARFVSQPAEVRAVNHETSATVSFELRPERRGKLSADSVWLRWEGPLGLVRLTREVKLDAEVAVVPNVGAARTAALRYFSSPDAQIGVKSERYIGEGSEFESLRQYVPGLDTRSIDWKASARHRRLLCRRFRAERNHQVVLAVDTGHLMSEPVEGIPRIDHAVTRALVLSYFCLRSGDRVGMHGFDAEPQFFLEPQGGIRAFSRLQHKSADIAYGKSETNFTLGILDLSRRLKRRSLVIVFTEFVDTVTAEMMLQNLDRLARRHVILFVTLRDPDMTQLELRTPEHLTDVNRSVVASELRQDRDVVFERLRRSGVHVIDAAPEELTVHLLNRYMDIKRRELV